MVKISASLPIKVSAIVFEKFQPIKQRYQLLAFIVAWVICYNILVEVLNANMENDLYPSEADSLSIPIFTNLFLGIFIFLICSIGVVLPKTKIVGILSILSFALASLLTLSGIPEWLNSNHYLIAIAHVIPLVVCLYMLLSAIKLRTLRIKSESQIP